jgi:3'(2'), 5'-bisphosphate nucleotidase
LLEDELRIAKDLAFQVGEEILRFVGRLDAIEYKENNEIVSEADFFADRLLKEALQKHFPDYGILTEESEDDLSRLKKNRVWIVDPLDGSRAFVIYCQSSKFDEREKHSTFSVMIGLAIEGESKLGVVYAPVKKELYFAVDGKGAYKKIGDRLQKLHVSRRNKLERMRLIVSHRMDKDEVLFKAFKDFPSKRKEILHALGYKICSIANGDNDVHFSLRPRVKEWDLCAPKVILDEAGGKVTDLHGGPVVFNKQDTRLLKGLIASNGTAHREIIRYLSPFLNLKNKST